MSGWVVRQFRGIAPRAQPRLLQDDQAQVAVNCKLWHGSIRPLSSNAVVPGDPLTKNGVIETIYRFGHDTDSDLQFWFHWLTDVDVCRGQIFDDTTERTYFTDGVKPQITDNSIALTGGTSYPMNSYNLGVPAPTACTATASGAGSGTDEDRYYTYTFVTAWGQEGRPADPVKVTIVPGQSVDLAELDLAPDGAYNIATKRIYRTSSVGSDAVYEFVDEVPIATVSYTDSVATENLGEVLSSNTYHEPPDTLRGLVNLANGMAAGFVGKEVYLCEPYKPHAWPVGYRNTVDYDIVALGSLDTTLVVLTKGFPYIMQGTEPAGMAMVKLNAPQACVSKRSVQVINGSVIYASPDGLIAIGSASAPVNLTEIMFTNKEWGAWFKPQSIHGYVFDNKYIGFYDNGTVKGGFILDPARQDFTLLDFHATAGYYDPQRDSLFLVVDGDLVKLDAGDSLLTASWRSKVFYMPRPGNLGAMRVEAAGYPVTVTVFADGVSIGSFAATSSAPFRLPGGFRANTWEFLVVSNIEVFSVGFAERMEDLRNG